MHTTSWLAAQVAAYTNGREAVSEYDCLLLQHVLWQRPGEAQRIGDYLLTQTASDSGGQLDLLIAGEHISLPPPLSHPTPLELYLG